MDGVCQFLSRTVWNNSEFQSVSPRLVRFCVSRCRRLVKGPRSGNSERERERGVLVELVGGKRIIIPRKKRNRSCSVSRVNYSKVQSVDSFVESLLITFRRSSHFWAFFFFFSLVLFPMKPPREITKNMWITLKEWEIPGRESGNWMWVDWLGI